jgi:hypothetical protein
MKAQSQVRAYFTPDEKFLLSGFDRITESGRITGRSNCKESKTNNASRVLVDAKSFLRKSWRKKFKGGTK